MIKDMPAHDVIVRLNGSLFEWVIENLSKNAVDAMQGEPGTITLHVEDTSQLAIVEVSDTGKGIRKKDLSNVPSRFYHQEARLGTRTLPCQAHR